MRYATAYTYGIPLAGFENIPSPTGSIAVDTQGSRGYPSIANVTPINFVGGVSDYYDDNAYIVISDKTTAGLVGRTTGGGGGPVVTIGTQSWMKRNLDVVRYRNGDIIPEEAAADWSNLTTGAWCWYNNNSANGPIYGKLYNWYAVNDPRGLAPVGFHVPTDAEWLTLMSTLGGSTVSGGAMKESGTSHWNPPNTGANNSSGFTALPGGIRREDSFSYINQIGAWWTSTEFDSLVAYYFRTDNQSAFLEYIDDFKGRGFSVRCIKDNNSVVAAEQVPTFWASKSKTDISFLNLVNNLPQRSGEEDFANNGSGLFNAVNWLLSNGYWTSYRVDNATLMIDNSPNFDIPEYLGVGVNPSDFTIEWWSYMDVDDAVIWSVGSNLTHGVRIVGGTLLYWIGGNVFASVILPQPYIGQWSYFTISRRKDGLGIWQNGISLTNDVIYTGAIPTNGLPLYLGSKGDGEILRGKMTNFRWTSENLYAIPNLSFTPPTAPLTVLTETKLLIFQGRRLSDQITDQSASRYTITNATGFYNILNPFVGVQGSIDFGYVVGFTFKVDNTLGNAGGITGGIPGAFINASTPCSIIVNWGDGSTSEYISFTETEIAHTYATNNIFNVIVYITDPTAINYIRSDSDVGNFQMLKIDYSRLVNVNTLSLYGNKLSSTQVNKLLSELVTNGLNNGYLNITEQTPSAPPTGQGLIDKATLISRNWTVTTD